MSKLVIGIEKAFDGPFSGPGALLNVIPVLMIAIVVVGGIYGGIFTPTESAAVGCGATLLVGGSWWVLNHEMKEVFEDNLKQVALAVANHHGTYGVARPARLAEQLPRIYEEYGKFEFVTAVWTRDGRRTHSSDPAVDLPFRSRSGLSEVTVNETVR